MQGTQMLITDVFNQNSGTFVIPVFQRNYDWKIEQCDRLLKDLEKLIEIRKSDETSIGLEDSFQPEYYPAILTLDGTIFNSLNNLKNVMVMTIKDLYMKSPNVFEELAQNEDRSFSTYAKDDKYERIAEGIYVDGSLSNPNKWSLLKNLFILTNTPFDTFELEVGIRKGREKRTVVKL